MPEIPRTRTWRPSMWPWKMFTSPVPPQSLRKPSNPPSETHLLERAQTDTEYQKHRMCYLWGRRRRKSLFESTLRTPLLSRLYHKPRRNISARRGTLSAAMLSSATSVGVRRFQVHFTLPPLSIPCQESRILNSRRISGLLCQPKMLRIP